jgi:hypothetical protein
MARERLVTGCARARIVAQAPLAAIILVACSHADGPASAEPVPVPGRDFDGSVALVSQDSGTARARAVSIAGGTLVVTRDGSRAVAADPDRDRVYVVDLAERRLTHTIALDDGDEPGRLVEDGSGRIHVVLRRAGAVAALDVRTGSVIARQDACPAPRGIAYDDLPDRVLVACRSGELSWLLPESGAVERQVRVATDLRDVVVTEGGLYATTLRRAEVIEVARDGTIGRTFQPNAISGDQGSGLREPHVGRRAGFLAGVGVFVQHQLSDQAPRSSSYGASSGCGAGASVNTVSVLSSGSTRFDNRGLLALGFMADFAVSGDGGRAAAVIPLDVGSEVFVIPFPAARETDLCAMNAGSPWTISGQAIAVAFDPAGRVLVQSREPAVLYMEDGSEVPLSDVPRPDPGHVLFHMRSRAGVACATCHPEGGDDGTTWPFRDVGLRRTQTISGGVLATAPLHWSGDRPDMMALMMDTFVRRMSGDPPTQELADAVARFVDAIPADRPPVVEDPERVERGRLAFAARGCDGCHSGERFTNNLTVDVGTGGEFQVPSLLGVAYRAPYLHDGCAETLEDRFGPCGGDRHGDVAMITAEEIADLVAYLRSL